MSAEEAAIFLRPPPKRYKSHAKIKAKARITSVVRQAAAYAKIQRAPEHGLHYILALLDAGSSVALRFTDEWQGALCSALIRNRTKASGSSRPLASTALTTAEDEEESPWPTAKLEHTLFDEWINSTEAQAIPFEIIKALNALTVAPDFPLPPIQTILEMLGGAKHKTAEDKIEAIRHWPEVLENETQVRQFLGAINCCCTFMGPDYADVARPLVDLTRKDVSFKWIELHTKAVQQLKQLLIDITTLKVPYTTKPFELYTNASGYAIGAVLEQEGKPIGFLSQVMNSTQQRYSIYGQEILALVTALDKWSHLLRIAKVTAYTDHQGLTHLQQLQASKPLRRSTARWLDFLAKFPDLHIAYVQGAHNQVADALSRRPGLPNACSHDTLTKPLMLAVEQTRVAPRSRGRPANYSELAGIRSRRSRQRTLPSPPTTLQPEPNREAEHPTPATKTRADPPAAPEWPQAYSKCSVFRAPYEVAAKQPGHAIQIEFRKRHSLSQKAGGLLQQLLIPSRRWAHVGLDFVMDLPLMKTDNDSILVMVDSFIKVAHFVPAKKSFSAADTVELLADRLIRYHGFLQVLISDRDPRFQSDLWQQLCHHFNIKRAMSSSYHLQSDGQTERVNRTLEQMLRTYIQSDEREWERLLPALDFAHNTTSHSSTELSPFDVMIGENPLAAAKLDIVGVLAPTLTPLTAKLFRQLCDRAQSHIQKAK
ncbi:hypothetical protein ENH_00020650 [Eimeria necatrix]|uniref:Integrase catalytic domain-containing protein n=1 Tax=Eimeria necatrix TaxID=51315 RepID=U6MJE2_9EIME|nr:hypothetical protein ENH_00020650 [Eimeria necatrix]CDJ62559.1 hypothetical protein ENH_00020650 [Eimeria necatrix]